MKKSLFVKSLLVITRNFGIVLIVITTFFAFLYSSLTRSFYHANPMKDPAYYELKERVLVDICNSILDKPVINTSSLICIKEIKGTQKYPITTFNGETDNAELKTISVRIGDVQGKSLPVYIHYHIQQDSNIPKNLGTTGGSGDALALDMNTILESTPEYSLAIIDADSIFKMQQPVEQVQSGSYTEFYSKTNSLPLTNTKFYQNRLGSFIALTGSVKNIYNLKEYLNNVPLVEPSFWKMYYFSVITFASVGFGDIVPISYSARVAVVLEIIIGIFFFGFFISALYDAFKNRTVQTGRKSHRKNYRGIYYRRKINYLNR